MRRLHLLWPHLPLRLALARLGRNPEAASGSSPVGPPLVLGGPPWSDGTVVDADPAARSLGVRRGIPLGSAHRLAPEASFLDLDPDADRLALEAACDRVAAFSPGVEAETDVRDPAFGRIVVALDGLERLWGPEPVLAARIVVALDPLLPGRPRAGIAGTAFAAGVAAAHAPDHGPALVVPPGGEAAFLASYPATLLTRDPASRARLALLGLRSIGAVAAIPRSALVARFGPEGERIHARARGEETERLRPRGGVERMALALPVEPPTEGLEAVRFVLRRLARALGAQLEARGRAAGLARLVVGCDPAFATPGSPPAVIVEERFPEPTADPAALERLLLAQLEREPPRAAVARLELELGLVDVAHGVQLPLLAPQAARDARLAWQLARLAITFGTDRVRRVVLADPEAPLAEARWRWLPAAGAGRSPGEGSAEGGTDRGGRR